VADIVDRRTRSRMMAGIRGAHTKPERVVRSFLHRAGLRFRLHVRQLPGRPDIVLSRHRAVVEVRGCFWHRHAQCRYATTPASNVTFWRKKFDENVARDRRNIRALRRAGWRVFVVWECQVTSDVRLERLARRIVTMADPR
jgi:DNA mismatch endonuclease, patch repair protein